MTFRKKLYRTLEPSERGGVVERIFEFFLITIIVLNILCIVLQSVEEIGKEYDTFFYRFEVFSVIFFMLEYIARIYSIVEKPKYKDPVKGRIRYALSLISIVDLLAFLPFLFSFYIDLRFLRMFRLMALFRMFKIARYLHALSVFKKVIHQRKEQLILSFIFILFVLVIISFIMFYAEHDAQPKKYSSILATMWWGIETLTTVGYGDMVPITPIGRILGGLFAVTGVALFALPAGILSSGFFELLHTPETKEKQEAREKKKCPHCGGELHD